MSKAKYIALAPIVLASLCALAREKWTPEQANSWYADKPFYAGANFIPSDAINQIEMWSSSTFNPELIDKELALAQGLGFNTMRVFLSDAVWRSEGEKFFKNVDKYLEIADKRGIKTLLVIFDSCWAAESSYGKQPEPKVCRHNSGWVKSPSLSIVRDETKWDDLEKYVTEVIARYKDDKRVVAWDIFNEPGNIGVTVSDGELKGDLKAFYNTKRLLIETFKWARAANPSQPITAGVFSSDARPCGKEFNKLQLEESDIISFHCYSNAESTKREVEKFKKLGRPVFCTEYMARPMSRFDPILGMFKEQKVAAYSWGFVSGKTQTIYPWDSNNKQYTPDMLKVWFHDIFYESGIPYDKKETDYIKKVMGK